MRHKRYFGFVAFFAFAIASISFMGCRPVRTVTITEQVPVYIKDSTIQRQKESERKTDSVIIERTVTVQVADSAMLEKLSEMGIMLDQNKEVIMVLQKELEKKVSETESMKNDSSYHAKETPVPIMKTEYVKEDKPGSWLNQPLIYNKSLIYVFIGVIAIVLLWIVSRISRKIERRTNV